MLNVLSINVNGLRERKKRLNLFCIFNRKKYDLIFVQETHCKDESESKAWSTNWEGNSIWNNGNSQSRGVAVLFRKHFDSDYDIKNVWQDENGRCISFSCRLDNDENYIFSNIYAPNVSKDRKTFYNELKSNLNRYADCAHIIGGDFNLVQNAKLDRRGQSEVTNDRTDAGHQELTSLCNSLHLEDTWRRRNPLAKTFTFSRGESKSRIDYFLCSKMIDNEISKVSILPCIYSDHDFIGIVINTDTSERGPGLWMFNASLLNDSNYIALIEQFWPQWSMTKINYTTISDWWELTKVKIKALTIEYSKSLKKTKIDINKLEQELSQLKATDGDSSTHSKIERIEKQIDEYYTKHREAFILRSKAKHILENETCSKYFFNLEKQRAKNKLWTQIKTERGEIKSGINKILNEQVNHYSTLLKSEQTNPNSARKILNNTSTKLTDSETISLDNNISLDEIYTAIYI